MKPLKDIVLVQVDPAEERSKSGLWLTEEWKTLPPFGTVLAVGPKVTTIKKGDRIVFERYASVKIEDEDKRKDLRLCKESHIMAKLA